MASPRFCYRLSWLLLCSPFSELSRFVLPGLLVCLFTSPNLHCVVTVPLTSHIPRGLGPITVLNKTIYDILKDREDAPNYLHFIGWVYMWGAILHWITAALNCMFF